MDFNLFSFLLGGFVFLGSFLAIMAWFVPDKVSIPAMSWIAARRNFSKVGLGIGAVMLVTFFVMTVIAVIKLLHLVQMADWVWWVAGIGLGFFLVSLAILLVTRRKQTAS